MDSPRRAMLLVVVAATLAASVSGCGVIDDTIEGLTATGPATPVPPAAGSDDASSSDEIIVTAIVTSDAAETGEITVTVDAPRDSQSFAQDSVDLPFEHEFTVPKDVAFPFRGSRIEADAGPGASWIECRILVDGEEVATHRAEGSASTAVCDRRLQLGPS